MLALIAGPLCSCDIFFSCRFAQLMSFDGKKADFIRSKYEVCGCMYVQAIIVLVFFPVKVTSSSVMPNLSYV